MKQTDEINQKIIQYLGEGLTIKEIASTIHKSIGAVNKRLKSLRSKFDAKNNIQLVKKVDINLPLEN